MRLVLLRSKYRIIGKINGRRDFWRNMEGQRNGMCMNDIRNRYILIFYDK